MAESRWQQGQLLVQKCCTLAGDESMEAGHLRIHSANLVSRMSARSIKGWQWCLTCIRVLPTTVTCTGGQYADGRSRRSCQVLHTYVPTPTPSVVCMCTRKRGQRLSGKWTPGHLFSDSCPFLSTAWRSGYRVQLWTCERSFCHDSPARQTQFHRLGALDAVRDMLRYLVRLRIVSYISRLPSDSELLVLHLRVRVKIAVQFVYVYLPTEHPLQSDSALGYRWKSVLLKMYRPLTTEEWYLPPFPKPPNGRTPTIPTGKFDINRPYHNLDQTPASTARASAVIPVSRSSSPPGRPGA
ncbi:hypothetical protein B0T13DRAFT_444736 [Neurospora crassa]|nr:hypothetical protein B0T13DRAFT_444736 [Neurospora crassa]